MIYTTYTNNDDGLWLCCDGCGWQCDEPLGHDPSVWTIMEAALKHVWNSWDCPHHDPNATVMDVTKWL